MSEDPWRRAEPGLHHEPVPKHEPVAQHEPVPGAGPYLAYQQDPTLTNEQTLGDDLLSSGQPRADDDLPEAGGSDADGDLAAELAAAAPRRWGNRITLYLGAATLLVGGFVGGVQVQKHYGEQPAAAGLPAGLQNRFGQNGGQQGGAQTGGGQQGAGQSSGGNQSSGTATAGGSATTGKVKLVDGTTVYVQTTDGNVVTVRTNAQTKVRDSSASALKNLAAGDSVTVQGQSGSDGTVTATAVTEEK